MRKFRLTALLIAVTLAVTAATPVLAEQNTWGMVGISDPDAARYAEDGIIVRVGCCECYVNNVRKSYSGIGDIYSRSRGDNISESFIADAKEARLLEGEIFVPLAFTAEALGWNPKTDENGGIRVSIGGESRTFSETAPIVGERYIDNVMCAPLRRLAELAGLGYYTDGDLGIASKAVDTGVEVPQKVTEQFRQLLGYNWRNVYMGAEGYVDEIAVHPKNPDLMYVATDVGGVYKWRAETKAWIPITDSLNFVKDDGLQTVLSLALDPNDENVIYYVAGNALGAKNGIMKSENQGASWTLLDFPARICDVDSSRLAGPWIQVDPNDSNTVYCGSYDSGLFVSHNAGRSWESCNGVGVSPESCPGGTVSILVDGRERMPDGKSKVIYAGTWGQGVYKSDDGGASFKLMKNSPVQPARMQLADGVLYASSQDVMGNEKEYSGGLFKCENDEWKNISPDVEPAKPGDAYNAFVVDPAKPGTIICFGPTWHSNTMQTYRSLDGGETWSYLGKTTSGAQCMADPKNPKAFYMIWGFGIYYFPDMYAERLEPTSIDVGIEELCCLCFLSSPSSKAPGLLANVMDRGTKVSERVDSLAKTLLPQVGKGSGLNFCEADPSFVVRTGYETDNVYGTSSVSVSTDYGRTMRNVAWNNEYGILDSTVSPTLNENGYPTILVASLGNSSGEGKGIWKSEDFGETWVMSKSSIVKNISRWNYVCNLLEFDKVNSNIAYYNQGVEVYVTYDGGETWRMMRTFPSVPSTSDTTRWECVLAAPGQKGRAWLRHDHNIYVTEDAGRTWSQLGTVDEALLYGFGIGKPGSKLPAVYLMGTVGGEEGIFISDDLGKSWRRISDDSHSLQAITYSVTGDRRVYGRVYFSTHGRGIIMTEPITADAAAPMILSDTKSSSDNRHAADYAVPTSRYTIEGRVTEPCEVRINGKPVAVDGKNRFSMKVELREGENSFEIKAKDAAGNYAEPVRIMLRYDPSFVQEGDTTPPELTVDGIPETTSRGLYIVRGRINESGEVRVNGTPAYVKDDLSFYATMMLSEGENKIRVQARDFMKNACKPQEYKITYSNAQKADYSKIDIPYRADNYVFDGYVDEWDLSLYCDKLTIGNNNNECALNMMWDEEYLYLGVKVIDDVIYNKNGKADHEDDAIEVYIDGDNHKGTSYNEFDKQFVYHYMPEDSISPNYRFRLNDEGYTCELRIPWSAVGSGVTPSANMKIGIDVDNVDNDTLYGNGGSRSGVLSLYGAADSWANPSIFSTATLLPKK